MSRIGKMPVAIPEKVELEIKENNITVKWPLGSLDFTFSDTVKVEKKEEGVVVKLLDEENVAIWWTTRSLIENMVNWVSEGFKKSLEIAWVGYKFEVQGNKIILSIGYSHKVEVEAPEGIKVAIDEKQKNILHITGIDKQAVWQFAAQLRARKKPEPYKGKGIKYVGEQIRRKAGKTGK